MGLWERGMTMINITREINKIMNKSSYSQPQLLVNLIDKVAKERDCAVELAQKYKINGADNPSKDNYTSPACISQIKQSVIKEISELKKGE